MKLFLSPHNDDETLFGAFTIQKHQPVCLVLFDSFIQVARGGDDLTLGKMARRQETRYAWASMGQFSKRLHFLGLPDDQLFTAAEVTTEILDWANRTYPDEAIEYVWAPAHEDEGHHQHNLVAMAALEFPAIDRAAYMTYTRRGKSRGREISPAEPAHLRAKLKALACYESQIDLENCREHFLRDLKEYQL